MDTQVWLADGSMGQEMRGEGWAKGAEWARLAQRGEGPQEMQQEGICANEGLLMVERWAGAGRRNP